MKNLLFILLAILITSCSDSSGVVEFSNGMRETVYGVDHYEVGDSIYVDIPTSYGERHKVSSIWKDTMYTYSYYSRSAKDTVHGMIWIKQAVLIDK